MMRTLALVAFLVAVVTCSARAETIYDRDGRPIGTARTQGNVTSYYDRDGRPLGTSHTTGETMTIYDRDGRPLDRVQLDDQRAPHRAPTPSR